MKSYEERMGDVIDNLQNTIAELKAENVRLRDELAFWYKR